jgi:phospholipase/carboxylesterase
MSGHRDDVIRARVNALLRAMGVLALIARHFHPPSFAELMASVGTPEQELRIAMSTPVLASERPCHLAAALDAASAAALQGFAGLREASSTQGDVGRAYRALRFLAKGLEALYPLAGVLPAVNLFFLDPSMRSDQRFVQSLLGTRRRDDVGVMQFGGDERGGFMLFVPESYTPERAWPLVMALHGGSGSGRQFLWSWLRDARSRGAILVAPTALGSSWALLGSDPDTPNIGRILAFVRSNWNVEASRLLLTGMSDGGTFTYVSGLQAQSPFTHLAPVSAAFHPLLVQLADRDRMRELPIHIIHGALDWMFPVELARQAQSALSRLHAAVTFREVDDLSHCYPYEFNRELLDWLEATPAKPPVVEA